MAVDTVFFVVVVVGPLSNGDCIVRLVPAAGPALPKGFLIVVSGGGGGVALLLFAFTNGDLIVVSAEYVEP